MNVICIVVIICGGPMSYVLGMSTENCVTPPMVCPNVNITFWLYTRTNKDDPFEVKALDSDSILAAPWVKGGVIKVLIHGYTGHKNYSPNTELRPAYLDCCDYNIVCVDYNKIAQEPCYLEAAANTELVGMCTAQLIDDLVHNHGFELAKFHIIGFSLGGHIAGYTGKYVTSGQLNRVTALDPALPMFATTDKQKKIDQGDAAFVDVIHVNALGRGKLESCGDVDFYANGGMTQPGCKSTEALSSGSCSHARAVEYFAESIHTATGFYASKCFSWIFYVIGWCQLFTTNEEILFGEYVPVNASGLYFFDTNSQPPYARGSTKSQTHENKERKRKRENKHSKCTIK